MLFCIHGLTENDLVWRRTLAPIGAESDCALLPGHGGMPCPEGTSIATLAAAYARRCGSAADVVGYSMGGRIALRLAADFPAAVRRLVLIGATPGIRDEKARAERRADDESLARMLEEDGIGAFVARWELHPTLRTHTPPSPGEIARLRSLRLSHDARGLAAAIRSLGTGVMEPLWERLPSMPTLLVAGSDDGKFRAEMETMAQKMPKATLTIIPGSGHAVHREQPEALLAAISAFLAS